MFKGYIITFDTGKLIDPFDYGVFHNKLISAKGVVDWWHYLKGTYIIIVSWEIDINAVSNFILQIAPNKHFFITEVKLMNFNGWLPQAAWDWINKYKDQIV